MVRPDEFYASIGGYMGPSYEVELTEDALVYTRMSDGYETEEVVELNPTDQQWKQFLEVVEQVDFWSWKDRYEDPNVMDGTGWTVRIEVGDRAHESTGANAYPGPDPTEPLLTSNPFEDPDERPFEDFTDAVETLIGDRRFR